MSVRIRIFSVACNDVSQIQYVENSFKKLGIDPIILMAYCIGRPKVSYDYFIKNEKQILQEVNNKLKEANFNTVFDILRKRIEGRIEERVEGLVEGGIEERVEELVEGGEERVEKRTEERVKGLVEGLVEERVEERVEGLVKGLVKGLVEERVEEQVEDLIKDFKQKLKFNEDKTQILNPETNRWVKADGVIGKKLLKNQH